MKLKFLLQLIGFIFLLQININAQCLENEWNLSVLEKYTSTSIIFLLNDIKKLGNNYETYHDDKLGFLIFKNDKFFMQPKKRDDLIGCDITVFLNEYCSKELTDQIKVKYKYDGGTPKCNWYIYKDIEVGVAQTKNDEGAISFIFRKRKKMTNDKIQSNSNSSIPNKKTSIQTPNNQSSSKASDVNSIANIRPGKYNTLIYNQLKKLIINGHNYDSFTVDDLQVMANDKELIRYFEYLFELTLMMYYIKVPEPLGNNAVARIKGLVPKSYGEDEYITFALDIRKIARSLDSKFYKTVPANKHYNGIFDLHDLIINKKWPMNLKLKQGKNYYDFLRE
jgi:hypothetical protein